jgi:hypothetical protein
VLAGPRFVRPPGPRLSRGTGPEPARPRWRGRIWCNRSPLEMPCYLQPRDFHVHGVAHVRANDLANRGTGHSMTTSDNRTRPACRSRRALTRVDLARHVEGDYGSEGDPRPLTALRPSYRRIDSAPYGGSHGCTHPCGQADQEGPPLPIDGFVILGTPRPSHLG